MKPNYMILKLNRPTRKVYALGMDGAKPIWMDVSDPRALHWKSLRETKPYWDRFLKTGDDTLRLQHVADPKTFEFKDVILIDGR